MRSFSYREQFYPPCFRDTLIRSHSSHAMHVAHVLSHVLLPLGHVFAMWALEARLEAALVLQMPVNAPLPGERARTLRAAERLAQLASLAIFLGRRGLHRDQVGQPDSLDGIWKKRRCSCRVSWTWILTEVPPKDLGLRLSRSCSC